MSESKKYSVIITKLRNQEEWDANQVQLKRDYWKLLKQRKELYIIKLVEQELSHEEQLVVDSFWKGVEISPSYNTHFGNFFWSSVVCRLSLVQTKELIERQFRSLNAFRNVIQQMLQKSNVESYIDHSIEKLLLILKELASGVTEVSAIIKVDQEQIVFTFPKNTELLRSELLLKINEALRLNTKPLINFSEYCMYITTPGSPPFPVKSSIKFTDLDLSITLEKIADMQDVLPITFYSPEIAQWTHRILHSEVDKITFLDHLRRSPQLGIAKVANEFCNHTRFNYLQQFVSNLTHLQNWGYGNASGVSYIRRELFILWFVASQYGHTADMYLGERFLVWQLQQSPKLVEDLIALNALSEEDANRFRRIAENGEWTQIHPLLAVIRLKCNKLGDIIPIYKLMDSDDLLLERKVFRVVRMLTFLELDTRFSMSNIQVNVAKELVAIVESKHEVNEDNLAATESLCEKLIRELQETLYVVPAVPTMMQALSTMGDEFLKFLDSGSNLLKELFKQRITLPNPVTMKSLFSLPFPVSELHKSSQDVLNSPVTKEAQQVIDKNHRIKCRDGKVFAWKAYTHEWSGSFTEFFCLSVPSKDKANRTLPNVLYEVMQKMFKAPKFPLIISEFDARALKRISVALAKFLWHEIFGTEVVFARSNKNFNWGMHNSIEDASTALGAATQYADKDTVNEIVAARALLMTENLRQPNAYYLMPIGGATISFVRNPNVRRQFDGIWFEIHNACISCTVIEVKSGIQTADINKKQFGSALTDLNMGTKDDIQPFDTKEIEYLKTFSVHYFTKSARYSID